MLTYFTLMDALRVIQEKPEFKVRVANGVAVIDYVVTAKDTFKGADPTEEQILKNLRGTAFDTYTGKIISLPFQKFHNLGECDGYMPDQINWENEHIALLKMDGSMIRPIPYKSGWQLATRAGVTDVSEQATQLLESFPEHRRHQYKNFIHNCIQDGKTPIFEFISRENRIVIDYPEPDLVLLAVRDNVTGIYTLDSVLREQISKWYPMIAIVNSVSDYTEENVRKWTHAEGVVLAFSNGFRVKIKAEDYVRKHKARDTMTKEKDVLALIFDDKVDDLANVLSEADYQKLHTFEMQVKEAMLNLHTVVYKLSYYYKALSRKDAAIAILKHHKPISSLIFKGLDGKYTLETLAGFLKSFTHTSTDLPALKEILNIPDWSY